MTRAPRTVLLLAALGLAPGCAPHPPVGAPWQATLDAEHPLVGTIVATATGDVASPDAMLQRLSAARFVLLGEKHDNPDHHRLQAWVVQRLADAGRRPAVVMEMLASSQQAALARHLRERPRDAEGLGAAVGFEAGWGPWPPYRPIAEAALAAGLPLAAGNLSAAELRRATAPAGADRDEALRSALALDRAYPDAARAALARIIDEGHCGQVPASAIPAMIDVQRARDGALARALARADDDGAVLIAGTGHTRGDLGVPLVLRALAPGATVASVAFVEVPRDARTRTGALAAVADVGPHDFVWFTPRVDDLDPCERFRKQLESMRPPR